MEKYKDLILEELEKAIVTEEEWEKLITTRMILEIEDDPFKTSVFGDDQGN